MSLFGINTSNDLTSISAKKWLSAALLVGLTVPNSFAFEFDSKQGEITGNFDTTFTVAGSMRVSERDQSNIGIGNGGTYKTLNEDNGNLNYGKGNVFSQVFKMTNELDLNFGKYGFFARMNTFYDFEAMRSATDFTPLSRDAKRAMGNDIKLLDLFVTVDETWGDKPVSLKVGNQVLSWGESTFIQNSINMINPIDVSKFRMAGAELKDALIPVPMIRADIGLTDNLNMGMFWQLDFKPTKIDPAGTYFSDNDFVSPGSTFANIVPGGNHTDRGQANANFTNELGVCNTLTAACGAIDPITGKAFFGNTAKRGNTRNGEDADQYGVSFNWYSEKLNNTEFGFFAARYNSRLPLISAMKVAGTAPTGVGTTLSTNSDNQAAAIAAATPATLLPTIGAVGGAAGITAAGVQKYVQDSTYFLEFPEDQKIYGISFNTMIKNIAWQGEYSFKKDQPLQVDDQELLTAVFENPIISGIIGAKSQLGVTPEGYIQGYKRKDVSQTQFTGTKLYSNTLGADTLAIVSEFAAMKVHGMEAQNVLRYEAQGTPNGTGYPNAFSWGYRVKAVAAYENFWGPVSFHPSLAFAHDVNGTSPKPISNFVEGRKSITLGLEARYQNTTAKFSYTNFFGAGQHNSLRDRDFVTLSFSKSF
ncbi:MAG: hypothetical protein COB02_07580 [Candidatus Cloacimonadota bacterium]|nr:MAG: hypothetical protein COB02_07580 [Candidatus Cloacimonadota bacterium]